MLIPIILAAMLAGPAMAQAAAPPDPLQQAAPVPLAPLPGPDIADDAAPSVFVAAARTAIALGRAGLAMEAIERAESRVLVRSVRPSRAGEPSDQAPVRLLGAARRALGQGDRAEALARLAEALDDPALDAVAE